MNKKYLLNNASMLMCLSLICGVVLCTDAGRGMSSFMDSESSLSDAETRELLDWSVFYPAWRTRETLNILKQHCDQCKTVDKEQVMGEATTALFYFARAQNLDEKQPHIFQAYLRGFLRAKKEKSAEIPISEILAEIARHAPASSSASSSTDPVPGPATSTWNEQCDYELPFETTQQMHSLAEKLGELSNKLYPENAGHREKFKKNFTSELAQFTAQGQIPDDLWKIIEEKALEALNDEDEESLLFSSKETDTTREIINAVRGASRVAGENPEPTAAEAWNEQWGVPEEPKLNKEWGVPENVLSYVTEGLHQAGMYSAQILTTCLYLYKIYEYEDKKIHINAIIQQVLKDQEKVLAWNAKHDIPEVVYRGIKGFLRGNPLVDLSGYNIRLCIPHWLKVFKGSNLQDWEKFLDNPYSHPKAQEIRRQITECNAQWRAWGVYANDEQEDGLRDVIERTKGCFNSGFETEDSKNKRIKRMIGESQDMFDKAGIQRSPEHLLKYMQYRLEKLHNKHTPEPEFDKPEREPKKNSKGRTFRFNTADFTMIEPVQEVEVDPETYNPDDYVDRLHYTGKEEDAFAYEFRHISRLEKDYMQKVFSPDSGQSILPEALARDLAGELARQIANDEHTDSPFIIAEADPDPLHKAPIRPSGDLPPMVNPQADAPAEPVPLVPKPEAVPTEPQTAPEKTPAQKVFVTKPSAIARARPPIAPTPVVSVVRPEVLPVHPDGYIVPEARTVPLVPIVPVEESEHTDTPNLVLPEVAPQTVIEHDATDGENDRADIAANEDLEAQQNPTKPATEQGTPRSTPSWIMQNLRSVGEYFVESAKSVWQAAKNVIKRAEHVYTGIISWIYGLGENTKTENDPAENQDTKKTQR